MISKFVNWFNKSIRNKIISVACVFTLCACICCTVVFLTSPERKAKKDIALLVNNYVSAMNNEDIDSYLDCLKIDELTAQKNQSSMKIIFEVYDLKTTVKSIDVMSIDTKSGTGKVRVVTTTNNLSGTSYQASESTTDYDVIFDSQMNRWYLGKSTLIDITYGG